MAALSGEVDLYFASRDLRRAEEYAARFNGIDAFGSYEEAVADPRVEAVYVCTPHHLHREHASLAFRAGKHVLVEKPIAGTLADAEAMIREAESAGVTFMVAENYRFLPPLQEAKRLIEQGRVGQLRLIQLHEQYPFKPAGWRSSGRPERRRSAHRRRHPQVERGGISGGSAHRGLRSRSPARAAGAGGRRRGDRDHPGCQRGRRPDQPLVERCSSADRTRGCPSRERRRRCTSSREDRG